LDILLDDVNHLMSLFSAELSQPVVADLSRPILSIVHLLRETADHLMLQQWITE